MNQHNFTLSRLALCVGLAISPAAAMAAQPSDQVNVVSAAQVQQANSYVVTLKTPGAWEQGGDLNRAQSAQDSLIKHIRSLDADAQVLSRSSKLINTIELSISSAALAQLQNHPEVASILAPQQPELTGAAGSLAKPAVSADVLAKAYSTAAPALSTDENAGAGITIAILSTGIDYTHKALGGEGTVEAYEYAKENAGAPEFDGFPTDVVIGGLDLAPEAGWGTDDNPLDRGEVFENYQGLFPSGRGTMLASLVHQHVPGAKLLAYKVAGYTKWSQSYPSQAKLSQAMEHAIESGADIIMIDGYLYGSSSAAYFDPSDSQPSGSATDIRMVNAAAAKGAMVVTTAGYLGDLGTKYNMSTLGAAGDALTVGGIEASNDMLMTSEWTPHGPVRGIGTIKPDMVTYNAEAEVATAGTGEETTLDSHPDFAAARMAAAAAIVKSSRGLSSVEVKALLTNTASNDIQRGDSGENASVTQIGSGVENIDAALSSPVMAWESSSYQPHLKFGILEVDGVQRITKEITLRNTSDQAQTYSLAANVAAKHAETTGFSWELPSSVTVPANRSVTVNAVLVLNGDELGAWELTQSDDFTIEGWENNEISGYLTLSSATQPELNLGWSVMPRAKASIKRNFATYDDGIWDHPSPLAWLEGSRNFAVKQSFTNTSNHDMNVLALPVMRSRLLRPEDKATTQDLLKHVGSAVLPEAACDSGQKLVMGIQLHDKVELAAGSYFDRGIFLAHYKIWTAEGIAANGYDQKPVDPNIDYLPEEQAVAYATIELDGDGTPRTVFIDLNKEYDWQNRNARYTVGKLPVHFVPGGDTVVSQLCLEEVYHHEIDSVEDLDDNLGFLVGTNRDALPTLGEMVIRHNPVKRGTDYARSYESWEYDEANDTWVPVMKTEYLFGTTDIRFNSVDAEGVEGSEWAYQMELAPGESAMLWSTTDGYCGGGGGIGPVSINSAIEGNCQGTDFMMLDLNSDFSLVATPKMIHDFVANVVPDQRFSVMEGAEAGTVIGKIDASLPGFFGYGEYEEEHYSPFTFTLVSALPGTPVEVGLDGTITVVNPDALDYENGTTLTLQVSTKQGRQIGNTESVVIDILNVNDTAPIQHGPLPSIQVMKGDEVAVSLAGLFTDPDGDRVDVSVEGLPQGLSFNTGNHLISGAPMESGEFTVTVTATDGDHSVADTMTVMVEAQPSNDSGSLGFGLPLLAWLMLRRRK